MRLKTAIFILKISFMLSLRANLIVPLYHIKKSEPRLIRQLYKKNVQALTVAMRGADPTNFQVHNASNCGVAHPQACASR